MALNNYPPAEGLYNPVFEHDSCGVGFVVDINGKKSHNIIKTGIDILVNLTHRGAVGSDPDTGDGAGILMQIPDNFMRARASELGFELPQAGGYAVGVLFLPPINADKILEIFERFCKQEGCKVLGIRNVPLNSDAFGVTASATAPQIKHVFIANPGLETLAFERKLYLIRRQVENAVLGETFAGSDMFYIPSLSSRTIIYKGLMVAGQVLASFPDLDSEEMQSAIAVVHQRYSTNTFPSWPLAQPFRYIAHNGEINTLRGNVNKMIARYATMSSKVWGQDIKKLLPIIMEGASDSACFDNMLELLVLSGRSLPHAILMMVPEAWGDKYYMGHDRRGFYEYHATFMEPWDGPAAIAFTDGIQVGGILDRNGLRPARFTITNNDLMIVGSETGVVEFPAEDIRERGRLQPGKMILIDTARKRVLYNDEVKAEVCRQRPYRRWVAANQLTIRDFGATGVIEHDDKTLLQRQEAFGYSREDIDVLLHPMARDGKEPVGSMGNDTPLAVLSDRPQLLFNYFKQNFAQVTNPPIDPIREDLVMSLTTYIGCEGNILEETPEHARRLKLYSPILTNDNLYRIRNSKVPELKGATLDITFEVRAGEKGMEAEMQRICREAEMKVQLGCTVLILSDRNVSTELAPIPSLLAISAVGKYLQRKGLRKRTSIILESGEPREVNHFALLSSYGCDAVNPYLALETLSKQYDDGHFPEEMSRQDVAENYIHAIEMGMMKILSKMGISTLRSYRGAQVYEAVGLDINFVDEYFTKTVARLGGIDADNVAKEVLMRHSVAFGNKRGKLEILESGGLYSYRRDGERHLWSPESIHFLQQATRRNDPELYQKFAEIINNQERRHTTLRSLFDFNRTNCKEIPIDEVESTKDIVRRFVTGAMSFGSLSREAHEAMAIAMNRIGAMSNSGEGGEDPNRYKIRENGDNACSATKQIASGRFGVTIEYLVNAKDLQIKVAQGAKPGEGGQLPGHKVNTEIARVRHSTPGVSLISPPPHHDIYSIEDLAQLIFDLKNANPDARISVKLVSECGVGTIAAGVSKGHADMVLISGGDGGTGASPLSSLKYAGMPWELGLSETHQTLVKNDLRGRIRVQTDGQMRTGRDVAIAALLGAEEFGFGTAALITLGCVMMRKCHLNTCPVGVATQDPRCRKRFTGKPEHLVNYFFMIAEELRGIMASLGIRKIEDMVGRCDLLKKRDNIEHWKAKRLDFSAVFTKPEVSGDVATRCAQTQDHGIDKVLDQTLIADCITAIKTGERIEKSYPIKNVDRTTGTMISGKIAKKYGMDGLPDDTIILNFTGSAGQSFASFAAHGLTMHLSGDANDYVGKGLSGGRIIVRPPEGVKFDPAENVIIGNTTLYGATRGEAYFNGLAGERFAVRNSGAKAVVEGVGDHGCEYMTGGVVAVLGRTGVNFAAGMSGGVAYVYDPQQDFDLRCNLGMVDLEPLENKEDIAELQGMIERHVEYTGSPRGKEMLENWDRTQQLFVKVMPIEYRRALGQMAKVELGSRQTEDERVEQA